MSGRWLAPLAVVSLAWTGCASGGPDPNAPSPGAELAHTLEHAWGRGLDEILAEHERSTP